MKIEVQLSGRLGNQLFQWSFAHLLSKQFGVPIGLFGDKYHQQISSDSEILQFLDCGHVKFSGNRSVLGFQLKTFDRLSLINPELAIKFAQMCNWNRSMDAYTFPDNLNKGLKFTGFFQNYHQVASSSDVIDGELSKITGSVYANLGQSLPKRYQFVHVRRGDLKHLSKSFGLLSTKWYEDNLDDSIEIIASTDDMNASQEVFSRIKPKVILNPEQYSPLQALSVMGNASRLVMGNSTLSWWGGYLAGLRGAEVIFPHPFFANNYDITEKLCQPNFSPRKSDFILD